MSNFKSYLNRIRYMEAADLPKSNSYIGVFLDDESKKSINNYVEKLNLNLNLSSFKITSNHITIALNSKELLNSGLDPEKNTMESVESLEYKGQLDGIGFLPNKDNPDLIAFRIKTNDGKTIQFTSGEQVKVKAKIAHITYCYNNNQKPVNSGTITDWTDINPGINISGILRKS